MQRRSGLFVLLLLLTPAAAGAATPPELTRFCDGHSSPSPTTGAGQCIVPRGIAVDAVSGDVYIADQSNFRVQKFSAWGEPLRAWGWDVVASGPGDDTVPPEDEFEVCVPVDGDVCKEGLQGDGDGQFGGTMGGGFSPSGPVGLGVDAAGDVYVADLTNLRVQKFSSSGEFLLMFGGEVNKTKVEEGGASEEEENLCPFDPGDECKEGVQGTGKGQFGLLKIGNSIEPSPDGETIYVGDKERIQEFDTDGKYAGEIAVPGETVQSLAVDPEGDLYLTRSASPDIGPATKPDVKKIGPSGAGLCTIEAHLPQALATGPDEEAYVVEGPTSTPSTPREIVRVEAGCGAKELLFGKELESTKGTNFFSADPTGIATSSGPTCGIAGTDLFISNPHSGDSFARIFGPPPDVNVCPPPFVPPEIIEQFALSAGAEEAVVRARINPKFWPDTSFYVQYGTGKCSEGGCEETALFPGSQLGAGTVNKPITTKAVLLGASEPLEPDTTYHFRFVAQSTGGGPTFGAERSFHTFPLPVAPKVDCPNQALRFGASARLPDCRAYEMVSPPLKGNGELAGRFEGAINQASLDGDALAYYARSAAFAEPEASPITHPYMAERDPEGWQSRSIAPPRSSIPLNFLGFLAPPFRAFTEDLCVGWLIQDTDTPLLEGGVPRGVPNLYLRTGLRGACAGTAEYELLTTIFPPGYDPDAEVSGGTYTNYFPMLQGFSADGEVSVFRAAAALSADACNTPNEGRGIFRVYLSQEGAPGAAPTLVSVLPDGEATCAHSAVGTASTGTNPTLFKEDTVHRAVSVDGSRVFWTDTGDVVPIAPGEPLGSGGSGPGEIYLRLNAGEEQSEVVGEECTEPSKACTIAVSAEAEAIEGTSASRYLSAAADGSVALFTTGGSLYEFDAEAALAGEEAITLIADKVEGIVGASEDASHVYLVSREALDGGATEGKPNLYLFERGVGHTFIATLSEIDVSALSEVETSIDPRPFRHTSRVTSDGLHAAFTSTAPLTGYDNTDVISGEPDREVFLYNADAGELICASCNPSGARPAGRLAVNGTTGGIDIWSAATIPGWPNSLHPSRVLSEDGQRLFFESVEALVLRDTNGRQDVYEWERAASEEECLEEIGGELHLEDSGGCLSLLSTGQGASDAELIDASPDGRDVFLLTAQSILAQDNGFRDAYDARELGGFPPPPPPEPECEADACRNPDPAPEAPDPASANFRGPDSRPEAPGCGASARKAKELSRQAKSLRRRAEGSSQSQALRRRSARLASKAKKMRGKAKRCRRARASRRAER